MPHGKVGRALLTGKGAGQLVGGGRSRRFCGPAVLFQPGLLVHVHDGWRVVNHAAAEQINGDGALLPLLLLFAAKGVLAVAHGVAFLSRKPPGIGG